MSQLKIISFINQPRYIIYYYYHKLLLLELTLCSYTVVFYHVIVFIVELHKNRLMGMLL